MEGSEHRTDKIGFRFYKNLSAEQKQTGGREAKGKVEKPACGGGNCNNPPTRLVAAEVVRTGQILDML